MKNFIIGCVVMTMCGYSFSCNKTPVSRETAAVLDVANRLNDSVLVNKVITKYCLDTNKLDRGAIIEGYNNPAFTSGSPEVLDEYIKNGNILKSSNGKHNIYDYVFSANNPYKVGKVIAEYNFIRFNNNYNNNSQLSQKELKYVNWYKITNDKYNYGRMLGYLISKLSNKEKKNQQNKNFNYIDYLTYNGFKEELELLQKKDSNIFISRDGNGNFPVFYALNHSCQLDKNELNTIGYVYGMSAEKIFNESFFNNLSESEKNKYINLIRGYINLGKPISRGLIELFTEQTNISLKIAAMEWGETEKVGNMGLCENIVEEKEAEKQKILYNEMNR